ncbi:FAS-associated factor 2 [Nephila pilipes]|uniref:FAS-associated factor 2 n=1 Tax=Nephila pilipes TaxID=299642 RepID=A0A8X6PJS8_NEPPI|nr:FAS-associated factor 2 [Nephila pilipes]
MEVRVTNRNTCKSVLKRRLTIIACAGHFYSPSYAQTFWICLGFAVLASTVNAGIVSRMVATQSHDLEKVLHQFDHYLDHLPVVANPPDQVNFIRADPRRSVTDPARDVMNFIQNFEEKYGRDHPIFYRGTYYQAVNDAKQDLKFLLVYLHGDDHQDTDEFCRTVLRNSEVVNFINASFLFWACSVNSPEGYRVSQALRENTYPFLAVIVLRDNQMTVVARLEGPTDPDVLIRRLRLIMNDNEASLIAARLERHERSMTQTIRQQQDEAYKESLKADQEKERRRREEQEVKAQQEQEERNKLLEEQKRKEDIKRQKIDLASQIPEEPPLEHPNTIRLMIKLPAGTRLERRFRREESLKFLYYFVFCHPESPDCFQIVTNFPRRVVPCEPTENNPEPPSFIDFGFGKSEMLFVQDLEA